MGFGSGRTRRPTLTTGANIMNELHKIEPSLSHEEDKKEFLGLNEAKEKEPEPQPDYEAALKQAADDIRKLEGEVKRSGVTIQQLNHEVDRLTDIIKRVIGI